MKQLYRFHSVLESEEVPTSISFSMDIPDKDTIWYSIFESYIEKMTKDGHCSTEFESGKVKISAPDRSKFGPKDWAILDALRATTQNGTLQRDGSLIPIKEPVQINGMWLVPNDQTEWVKDSKWVANKMGYGNLHCSKNYPYTPIGKIIGLDGCREAVKEVIEVVEKARHRDLLHGEKEEVLPDKVPRGLMSPLYVIGRMTLYRTITPQTILVDSFKFREPYKMPPCKEFQILSDPRDVWMENPRGASGAPRFEPLTTKGVPYTQSKVYQDELREAIAVLDLYKKRKYSRRALMGMSYPHQTGVRFQGIGRMIVPYSKRKMIPASMIGQPLTLSLEQEPWYASGDMMDRISAASEILNGEITEYFDGDDGVYVFEKGEFAGVPAAMDLTAYESLITWQDWLWWMKRVMSRMTVAPDNGISLEGWKNIFYNLVVDETNVGFLSAYATFLKEAGLGVNSGSPFTHQYETELNKVKSLVARSLNAQTIEELSDAYLKTGAVMRPSAQYVPVDGHVMIAKRVSDGTEKGTCGLVVRAVYSTCFTEGPWDIPDGMTQDEWEESRILSIGINIYYNPAFSVWLKLLRKANFKIKSNPKTVFKGALRYVEKRRGSPIHAKRGGEKTNTLEKRIMLKVYNELLAL